MAIRRNTEELQNCPADVIKNYFSHCFKAKFHITEESRRITARETVDSMSLDATKHNIEFTRAGLTNLLNPVDEDIVTEKRSISKLGQEILGVNEEED